ncbi:hypothetical protein P9112_013427 [Eukaryota sp. TZLM1-RC]
MECRVNEIDQIDADILQKIKILLMPHKPNKAVIHDGDSCHEDQNARLDSSQKVVVNEDSDSETNSVQLQHLQHDDDSSSSDDVYYSGDEANTQDSKQPHNPIIPSLVQSSQKSKEEAPSDQTTTSNQKPNSKLEDKILPPFGVPWNSKPRAQPSVPPVQQILSDSDSSDTDSDDDIIGPVDGLEHKAKELSEQWGSKLSDEMTIKELISLKHNMTALKNQTQPQPEDSIPFAHLYARVIIQQVLSKLHKMCEEAQQSIVKIRDPNKIDEGFQNVKQGSLIPFQYKGEDVRAQIIDELIKRSIAFAEDRSFNTVYAFCK